MNKPIIQANDVVKIYKNGKKEHRVLNGVSATIHSGEFVSIMGPSGSGKSTLLFALSGMEMIDSGKVIFAGHDISRLNDKAAADLRRQKMGFVFQQPTLLRNLNILDNIILTSLRDNIIPKSKVIARAEELMEQTGIAHIAKNQITQASGGELQRAGICRALMNKPAIIFGDEPTGALNSQSAQVIMDIFKDIHSQGITILLVTHDVRVAAHAERVLFMRDGEIISELKSSEGNNGKAIEANTREIMQKMELFEI